MTLFGKKCAVFQARGSHTTCFVKLDVLIAHILVGLNRAGQEHMLLKP